MTQRDVTHGAADDSGMERRHLGDLIPDRRNARRHTPRNVGAIERSLSTDGFGRSILLARDGTVIAGNATIDAAAAAGIEDVVVVDSDGSTVIAVRRTDVESGTDRFYALAVADNRSAELAEWDPKVLASLAEDGAIPVSALWTDQEWSALMSRGAAELTGQDEDEPERCPHCGSVIRT